MPTKEDKGCRTVLKHSASQPVNKHLLRTSEVLGVGATEIKSLFSVCSQGEEEGRFIINSNRVWKIVFPSNGYSNCSKIQCINRKFEVK